MIDCHLHLQDERFSGQVEHIMESIRAEGISRLVVNGTSPLDWSRVSDLAKIYPEVVPCFGLHPWKVNDVAGNWDEILEGFLETYPSSGVGEIGLDRWIQGHDFAIQKERFEIQLRLAERWKRPVSIHCLQAWGSLLEILTYHRTKRGFLLHSFGGPVEMVGDLIALGAYFSISGYFFRDGKEKKRKSFELIPDDRILIETDAPDMLPPESLRWHLLPGESPDSPSNHPANLTAIYGAFANWRGLSPEKVDSMITDNFDRWSGGIFSRHES